MELVLARQLNTWLAAPLQTAQLYAEGLVNGAVTVVTDANDWQRIPAALGRAIDEDHEASGFRWTLNVEEWRIGIGSVHGLAHGVIECAETGTRYGVETDLHVAWFLYPEDLRARASRWTISPRPSPVTCWPPRPLSCEHAPPCQAGEPVRGRPR
jgi:hypothetical protein